jgi:hypothetical protein
MFVDRNRFIRVFAVIAVLDVALFSLIVLPRSVLTAEQWKFLEQQRPSTTRREMFACSDCLNFALARRAIGGWDGPGSLFELLNVPAALVARRTFHERQMWHPGSSKQHSDFASYVFGAVALAQCACLAALASLRRSG